MFRFRCKECGDEYVSDDERELVEKVHGHMHVDHGKHVGIKKIKRRIEEVSP